MTAAKAAADKEVAGEEAAAKLDASNADADPAGAHCHEKIVGQHGRQAVQGLLHVCSCVGSWARACHVMALTCLALLVQRR